MENFTYSQWLPIATKFKNIMYLFRKKREEKILISFFEEKNWCGFTQNKFCSYELEPNCRECPLCKEVINGIPVCHSCLGIDTIFSRFLKALKEKDFSQAYKSADYINLVLEKICPDSKRAYEEGFRFGYLEELEKANSIFSSFLNNQKNKFSSKKLFG